MGKDETTLKPRHRWEDNIKTDVKALGWEGIDLLSLAWDWEELCM